MVAPDDHARNMERVAARSSRAESGEPRRLRGSQASHTVGGDSPTAMLTGTSRDVDSRQRPDSYPRS